MNPELSQLLETMIRGQAKYDSGVLNIVRDLINLIDTLSDRVVALDARVRKLEEIRDGN